MQAAFLGFAIFGFDHPNMLKEIKIYYEVKRKNRQHSYFY